MNGVIRVIKGAPYVEYRTSMFDEPTETIMRWKVEQVRRSPYGGRFPEEGDKVASGSSSDTWNGSGYDVWFSGQKQAEHVENRPISPPKVRVGVNVRYRAGHWEKYTKRYGWIYADDGAERGRY